MANIVGTITINQSRFFELDGSPLASATPGVQIGDFCIVDGSTGIWQKTGPGDSEFVRIDAWTAFVSQATTAGTLVLTADSNSVMVFTGATSGQIVQFPDTTTLIKGFQYYIFNDSTQVISVKDSASGLIYNINAGSRTFFVLTDNSTAAGSWTFDVTLPAGGVSAHAFTHLPDTGSDPLTIGTPTTIGTANAAGTANSFPRADHVHNHGAQTAPTHHAVVTQTDNGFMSSGDKTKLDTLVAKAGIVSAGSFSGNPKLATVTFTSPFVDNNYAINLTGIEGRVWIPLSVSAGGFTINTQANAAVSNNVYWVAIHQGEI